MIEVSLPAFVFASGVLADHLVRRLVGVLVGPADVGEAEALQLVHRVIVRAGADVGHGEQLLRGDLELDLGVLLGLRAALGRLLQDRAGGRPGRTRPR